uniref:Uncharacterized protein n=1 Tax=Heterorhabditis bacteriophora TaxID=37862 RepID=A0A1I7WAL8_HETBA
MFSCHIRSVFFAGEVFCTERETFCIVSKFSEKIFVSFFRFFNIPRKIKTFGFFYQNRETLY